MFWTCFALLGRANIIERQRTEDGHGDMRDPPGAITVLKLLVYCRLGWVNYVEVGPIVSYDMPMYGKGREK